MRLLLAWLLLAAAASAQTSPLFSQVDGMLASLSKITGWEIKRKVPSEVLSRDKFRQMVEEDVANAEKDKTTRAAELTLKMFGLVPWDFHLARESADLIEEQAAAFYDVKKKRLFILDSLGDGPEEQVALAHELAHALADQQFNLKRFIQNAKDDDAATARESVIEGQASWLSWAYMAERAGGKAEVPQVLLDELADVGATGEDFPVLTQTPLYMRESLTFPYTAGMRFQDAVYRQFGTAAFSRVFREPPLSTQEILHPEAYADAIGPTRPEIPKPPKGMRLLAQGDVGEFDYSAILRQFIAEERGRRVAGEWRGGAYRLYEHKKTKAPLLMHSSHWSSPEAAREFFATYRDVLKAKWPSFAVRQETPAEIAGTGDRGEFLLRISGATVQVFEGLPRPEQVE